MQPPTVVLTPSELAVLFKAFDNAWDLIKPQYNGNGLLSDAARLRLANAVIKAFEDGLFEPDLIPAQALDRLHLAYPE